MGTARKSAASTSSTVAGNAPFRSLATGWPVRSDT